MCFFNLDEYVHLVQNEHFSTFKSMICRMYSLQKLTQVSLGSNVPNAATSNIDGFLWRDTCVSSI
jgi:hypothetical protein